MAKLVCQSGPTAGHEYPLLKDLTVMGRQSACDVQIIDSMASRAHCQVRRDGKLYTLVDLGSRNGTKLNGHKVGERQMAFGDRIRVGECEYLLVKEPGDIELKDLLSKYEIKEKIGEGGMGIVYKAVQRSMARTVALKILAPKYAARPKFVEQFIREARAAGQLNHPNIIQVHDVGSENDIHYFSMEFVDGPTCMQMLRDNDAFTPGEALEITRQVAKALEYAHGHRLIHQDIKPDNIMVGANNLVKLADLGISKTFDEVAGEEASKKVMGTPHYMAPEAAMGKKIDQRVDIYSLGATLYHLLTGKTPYHGSSATEVLKAHVMDPLPPIRGLAPGVPADVCQLVEKMMAKKPEDRFQSAADVLMDLDRLQSGVGLGQERIGGSETLILRRYLEKGPAKGPRKDAAPEGSGTRAINDKTATGEQPAQKGGSSAVLWVLAAGVLVVAGLLAALLWPRGAAGGPGDAPVAGPVAGPATVASPVAGPAQPDPELQAAAVALGALEREVRAADAKADLVAFNTRLGELAGRRLDPALQARVAALRQRLGELLSQRQAASNQQALDQLEKEVQKLSDERNYDLAMQRLDAYRAKDDPRLRPKWDRLRSAVESDKRNFTDDLQRRVQSAAKSKDAVRLKQLRDQLPQALLGSPIEAEIQRALKQLDDEAQVQYAQTVQAAARDFARWDFAAVEDTHRARRAAMGASPHGKELDKYRDAAQRLPQFTQAVGDRLKQSKVRFRGTLKMLPDPDLIGANAKRLQMDPAEGGTTEVNWKDLAGPELLAVASQVLKDEAESYRAALQLMAEAKLAGDGK